ncbi:matrix metalloproteinase-2 isoform X2 [Bacillus rossius redtenbacheri]|uniref:matrix metalloproteinase-2 isoform X2 n=1 Tax=Bacillus rossius redtenbacheri TaxID=93214 RepID=UPI002FDD3CDA
MCAAASECGASRAAAAAAAAALAAVLLASCWCPPACGATFVGDNVQNYLMNFGYLPQSDLETGNLRTEDQLRNAIKDLQAFASLNATGELDEATKKLLSTPRCGLPDIAPSPYRSKRFTLQGQKWHHTDLTWSLRTQTFRALEPGYVRAELDRALSVWSQHSKLTFREVNSDRADILVYFQRGYHGDGYPFDGPGQILAHAFFPGTGRGGDAHFDEEENWLLHDQEEEGTNLFAVAAHEFGHSLGLSHSSVQGALMYPWYQGLKPTFQLPEDDRYGIQQLYGAKEEKLWDDIQPYHPNQPPQYPTRPTQPPQYPTQPPQYPNQPPQYPNQPPSYPNQPPQYPNRPPQTNPGQHPQYPNQPPQYPNQPPQYPRKPPHQPTTPPHKPHYPSKPRYPVKPEYPHHPTNPTRHPNQPPQDPTQDEDAPRDPEPPPRKPVKPNTCDTSYDAISIIRQEVFIFKDRYLWRIGDKGLQAGYPVEIKRIWKIPENYTHIDAVYERLDKKIVFFIGKKYYLFEGATLQPGYPKLISRLGLPDSLEKVDAAMVWGHNSKTYFYSGTMYWRLWNQLHRGTSLLQ